ncbi:MAG TPA: hypothetical protein VK972_00025, partial [Wenzhouxiangella sp.]|nr:hypothetical protein [Wenzhouxiangella sp.]
AIKSALIDLINSGRLTIEDGQLFLDAEPVAEETEGEYDAEGWSIETSYGCRRHRAIDEVLARLERGDKHERRVANDAYRWFCFHPREAVHLAADDETEAKQAVKAYFNSNLLIRLLGGVSRRDNAMDYRIAAENWEGVESDHHWFMPPGHAVVYGVRPEAGAPQRWPQQYINDLKDDVEYHRSGRAAQAEDMLTRD